MHDLRVGDRVVAKYPPYRGQMEDPWFTGVVVAPETVQWTDGTISKDSFANGRILYAPHALENVGMGRFRSNVIGVVLGTARAVGMPFGVSNARFASPISVRRPAPAQQMTNSQIHILRAGEKVVAKYPPYRGNTRAKENPWFAAVVKSVQGTTCSVMYDDGDVASGLTSKEVLFAPHGLPPNVGKDHLRFNDHRRLNVLLVPVSFGVPNSSRPRPTSAPSFSSSRRRPISAPARSDAGRALFVAGLSAALGGKDYTHPHMDADDDGKATHRIMFLIAPGSQGFGKGDVVSYKGRDGKQYECVIVGRGSSRKHYDLQIKLNGQLTQTVVPNVSKSDFSLIKAKEDGNDDVDLRGVWSGDVGSILKTLGGTFDFAISKECGQAPKRSQCMEKLKRFFSERDWPFDYYWIYYSGHGSSAGGAWCLPSHTRLTFADIYSCWKGSEAQNGGARLVIISDSCYCGKIVDAARQSRATDVAVQGSSISDSTSLELGWEGGNFTHKWCSLIKSANSNNMGRLMEQFKLRRQGCTFHIGWQHRRVDCGRGKSYSEIQDGPHFVSVPKDS